MVKKLIILLGLLGSLSALGQQVQWPVYVLPGNKNTIPMYSVPRAGIPVFGPSNLIDNGTGLFYKGVPLNGGGTVTVQGTPTANNCVKFVSATVITDAGSVCGSGGGSFTLTTTGTSGAATYSSGTLNIPQYQAAITLTTTGSSGAATLVNGALNIPTYAGGGSMTWPAAIGIANYAGSNAWGTSYSASNLIPANFISTLNQSTTGTSGGLSGTPNISIANLIAGGSVTFSTLGPGSGFGCLHIGSTGIVTNTGSDCGVAGVSSIDTQTGAFTFTGTGVSHTGTAYTFTSSGGSMVYPSGSGIPQVNSGTSWSPSIFYVDTNSPSSCTVNSVAYTTAFDCAFATAKFWVTGGTDSAQFNATLLVGATGKLTTNVGIQEPSQTNNHGTVNIVGDGPLASNIQLVSSLSAGVCMVTQPDEVTSANSAIMNISGVTFDANQDADCVMSIHGVKSSSFKDLRLMNARPTSSGTGGRTAEFGGASGSTVGQVFEAFLDDIAIDGNGNASAGGYTPAIITTTISSGNPVSTVTNGGTYPGGAGQAFLHGVGNGSGPCSVYPTPTLVFTGTALTSVTWSGGTCVGPVYASVTMPPISDNGVLFNGGFTDSTIKDLRVIIPTYFAAVKTLAHPNHFVHAHIYAGQPVGIEDYGSNLYEGTECDSLGGFCGVAEGPSTRFENTMEIFNSFTRYAGSALYYVDQTNAAISFFANGTICTGNRQGVGGYHNLVIGTGLPYNNTSSAGGAVDAGFTIPNNNIQLDSILDCSALPGTTATHIGNYSLNGANLVALSLTTTGSSGAATYNSTTGVLNVPSYTGGGASAFSAITTGTNATALLMGTGGSLGTSGTGTITATAMPWTGLSGSVPVLALPSGSTAITQLSGDVTTKIANDAFVAAAITGLQPTITLTTTGTSGAATFSSGTLNIPNYATSGGSPAFSAVTAGTNTVALLMGTGGSLGATGSGTITATAMPYSGLTGSVPTWNQNTTGSAASATTATTATSATSATTATTATNLSGGLLGSEPYQSAANTTVFLASPTTSGHTFVKAWTPTGSAIAPVALDLATYLATPPAIGSTTPGTGAFTTLTTNQITVATNSISSIGTVISSASTIAPVTPIVHVSGTATITTITPPTGCTTALFSCSITLIADGAWATGTSGNIGIAITMAAGSDLDLSYDPTSLKWYPNAGGSSGGSGTVNSGTIGHFAYYASSTTAVSSNTNLTDLSNVLTYAGTGGIIASAGPISSQSDGTHAASLQMVGNTTLPILGSNVSAIVGPSSATVTSYSWQMPTAINGAAGLIHIGAPSSTNSALSVSLVAIADLSATGTPSSTTYLRGDNTWGTPAGSGTTVTIASGTSALGTSAIASGACATVVTTTATGTATTDAITWNPNGSIKAVTGYTPSTSGGLTITPYPTSGNVNFDVCNWTASSITPGAVTLNWRVTR